MPRHDTRAHQDLADALAVIRALLDTAEDNAARPSLPVPEGSHLAAIAAAFDLDAFEFGVVLLCAAMELMPGVDARLAELNGSDQRPWPTLGVALAVLPDGHWSALLPTAPLRRHRLIELEAGPVLTERPMSIAERVLHALMGARYVDPGLGRYVRVLHATATLPDSHRAAATRLAALWDSGPVHLWCDRPTDGLAVAAAAAGHRTALHLEPSAAPPDSAGIGDFLTLWGRESRLSRLALVVDIDDAPDVGAATAARTIARRAEGAVVTCGRDPRSGETLHRLRISRAPFAERVAQWEKALDDLPRPDGLEEIVARFQVTSAGLDAAVDSARRASADHDGDVRAALWEGARVQAHPELEDLAQRLPLRATWSQLVLPAAQQRALRALLGQTRRTAVVDHLWGFTPDGAAGGGTAAVFSGPSGTGKTMAAEVLAGELDLDLFRIDLSAVVSKYIGETEKNLRRVFDAAEAGGAVLLFDEADALFGKRTEVRDSHDRHANIEVSYLLQRMESYNGLAILTTNHRSHLDEAFLRRIPVLIEFPFPDPTLRAAIWRGAFPPRTPTNGLDPDRLARLSVAGGSIRSIARTAAFLAADAGRAVTMADLRQATELEYDKLGRSLTPGEARAWS